MFKTWVKDAACVSTSLVPVQEAAFIIQYASFKGWYFMSSPFSFPAHQINILSRSLAFHPHTQGTLEVLYTCTRPEFVPSSSNASIFFKIVIKYVLFLNLIDGASGEEMGGPRPLYISQKGFTCWPQILKDPLSCRWSLVHRPIMPKGT